jgi:hypothetical protein
VRSTDEEVLREYAGVYQWGPNAFVYLQMWSEFTGTSQLGAFDESGEVRALYPGVAVPASIESRVEFQRDGTGKISALTWQREGAPPRIAPRVEIEKHEEIRFSNGDIQLAGTLIRPNDRETYPVIILACAWSTTSRCGASRRPGGPWIVWDRVSALATRRMVPSCSDDSRSRRNELRDWLGATGRVRSSATCDDIDTPRAAVLAVSARRHTGPA